MHRNPLGNAQRPARPRHHTAPWDPPNETSTAVRLSSAPSAAWLGSWRGADANAHLSNLSVKHRAVVHNRRGGASRGGSSGSGRLRRPGGLRGSERVPRRGARGACKWVSGSGCRLGGGGGRRLFSGMSVPEWVSRGSCHRSPALALWAACGTRGFATRIAQPRLVLLRMSRLCQQTTRSCRARRLSAPAEATEGPPERMAARIARMVLGRAGGAGEGRMLRAERGLFHGKKTRTGNNRSHSLRA